VIAFVLSGGAGLGAIQVGMLRALYEHEIAPDLIVGTSAGAVNGAFIASRPQRVQTAEALASVWEGLTTLQVFPPNPVTAALGLLDVRDYLVSNSNLKSIIGDYLQFEELEDAPIPLRLIATEVRSGAERRLASGDAETAILASAAIPGVFPSIKREGETLVDGGVSNNTPISDAAELGAGMIYVLPTGAPCELPSPPRGAIPMLVHAIALLINQRLVADIEHYSEQAQLIVLPPPCPAGVYASDFGHAHELIEQGHELASEALDHPDPAGYWTPRALARLKPDGGA
jgi:NTE family protein